MATARRGGTKKSSTTVPVPISAGFENCATATVYCEVPGIQSAAAITDESAALWASGTKLEDCSFVQHIQTQSGWVSIAVALPFLAVALPLDTELRVSFKFDGTRFDGAQNMRIYPA